MEKRRMEEVLGLIGATPEKMVEAEAQIILENVENEQKINEAADKMVAEKGISREEALTQIATQYFSLFMHVVPTLPRGLQALLLALVVADEADRRDI
jgi:hypothetical protein